MQLLFVFLLGLGLLACAVFMLYLATQNLRVKVDYSNDLTTTAKVVGTIDDRWVVQFVDRITGQQVFGIDDDQNVRHNRILKIKKGDVLPIYYRSSKDGFKNPYVIGDKPIQYFIHFQHVDNSIASIKRNNKKQELFIGLAVAFIMAGLMVLYMWGPAAFENVFGH